MEEAKQVATILSVIGGKTYALLAPDKPTSKSLKQLKKTLQTYFESKPVDIVKCELNKFCLDKFAVAISTHKQFSKRS